MSDLGTVLGMTLAILPALFLLYLAFVVGLAIGEDSLPGNEGDVPPGWGRDER